MKRLLTRTRESLRDEGFLRTCGHAVLWTGTRGRIAIPEPSKALRELPVNPAFEACPERARIAVHIHLYYTDLIDEMIGYTNHIPYRFDCYVSTDTEQKAERILEAFERHSRARSVQAKVFPNRGRDMAPFIAQLTPCIAGYDYVLHLHTKHSTHDDFGNQWRRLLLKSLLASEGHVAALLDEMERQGDLGLMFARTYWRVKPSLGWKGNFDGSRELLRRMGIEGDLPRFPRFPAGNMFWARTKAVMPAFTCGLTMEDFPAEQGQTDDTTAHCLERCWAIIAKAQGYRWMRVRARS